MLFGGLGHGFGGGVGLIELLLLGALAYFAFSFLRRRREAAPAVAGGYGMTSAPGGGQTWQPDSTARSVATVEPPAAPGILDVGIGRIRQMDAGFDPARMTGGGGGHLLQAAGGLDGARYQRGPRQPDARDVRADAGSMRPI